MAIGYSVGTVTGVDFGATSELPIYPLGTEAKDNNGTTYIYVKGHSSTATSQYLVCEYNTSFQISTVAVTSSTFGTIASNIPAKFYNLGVFQGKTGSTTLPSAYYGWIAIEGPMTIATAGAVTAGAVVYSNATAGKVDDANAGATTDARITGLYVITDPGGAGNASCFAKLKLCAGI